MKKDLINKRKKLLAVILCILILGFVILYLGISALQSRINGIIMLFTSNSVSSTIGYIRSYNIYGFALSCLLMLFQSVVFPFSHILVISANSSVFGWWQGAFVSYIGIIIGATVCFFITRILFLGIVEKLFYNKSNKVVRFLKSKPNHILLIFRILPFMPFDTISYLSGITYIKFKDYIVSTALMSLPMVLIYSYVGEPTGLLSLFLISTRIVLSFVIFYFAVKDKFLKNEH